MKTQIIKAIICLTLTFAFLSTNTLAQRTIAPGDLDTTFNGNGKVATSFSPSSNEQGHAIAIQSDGKIVVAGHSNNGSNEDFAIARYNTDGSLDTTFDTDGKVIIPIGAGNDYGLAVAIQSDGKMLVAGYSFDGNSDSFAVARINADGSVDTSFDSDGKVTTTISAFRPDRAYSMAIHPDGKIVIAGITGIGGNDSNANNFAVIRYNTDGSLDTSFDSDGYRIIAVSPEPFRVDRYGSIAIQPDGKIVIAGSSNVLPSGLPAFSVFRLNTNGTSDTSFGTNGIVTTSIGANNISKSIALQNDGKILVGGSTLNSSSIFEFAAVRFNTDGSLDSTFDTDGKFSIPIGASHAQSDAMAIQNNGQILLAGNAFFSGTNTDFTVIRLNSDGSLDNSLSNYASIWGTGGISNIDFTSLPLYTNTDIANAIALDSNGRAIVGGYTSDANTSFAVARFQNLAPTAAAATVAGRVQTASGRGIPRAMVFVTNSSGQVRTARTNVFGYFQFADIEVGGTYVFNAQAKGYSFETQVLNISEDIKGLSFTAQ